MTDLKLAFRALTRERGFTAIAVLTLALAIGATTAIFSVADATVLRPLPYRDPDRLVAVENVREDGRKFPASPPELRDWRARTTAFAGLAGYSPRAHVLRAGNTVRRVPAAAVSANFFDVLGVAPEAGRGFATGEDVPGAGQVAVISHALWLELGGTPDVVGRNLTIDERPYTVVGVAPPALRFPPSAEAIQVWLPWPATETDAAYLDERQAHVLRVVGRLAPGVALEAAAAEMATVGAGIAAEHPRDSAGMRAVVTPLQTSLVADVRGVLLMLLGAVGFVLLIGCANVANLLLARATGRRRELAIQTALGASRRRIVGQHLIESLLLAAAGGALGVLFASWAIAAMSSLIPPELRALGEIAITGRVLAFSAGIALCTALVFGVVPAWQGASAQPAEVLKQGGAQATTHHATQRLRALLVAGEIAVATVLLVGAGLLAQSFAHVAGEEPGFDPAGLWLARVPLTGAAYNDEDQTRRAYQRLLDAVQSIPGVEHAAVATAAPFSPIDGWAPLWRADRPRPDMTDLRNARFHGVSPSYFTTMRVPLLGGRDFAAHDDRPDAPPVMVISRTAATALFGDEPALGKRLLAGLGDQGEWEVVGVVSDVKGGSLEEPDAIEIYVPFQRFNYAPNLAALVRVAPDLPELDVRSALRQAATTADPALPIPDVRPMTDAMHATLAQRTLHTVLLCCFAAGALLLALVGIYGVMAYNVGQRRREIAIRMAMGATGAAITRLVVWRALLLAVIGVAVGCAAALGLARLLTSLLYGVTAADPRAFVAAAALQVAVAAAGAWLPARRAARVSPMEALRS